MYLEYNKKCFSLPFFPFFSGRILHFAGGPNSQRKYLWCKRNLVTEGQQANSNQKWWFCSVLQSSSTTVARLKSPLKACKSINLD